MNKSGVKSKRSFGKESSFSKRPKLDFTLKSKESKNVKSNNTELPKSHNGAVKEKFPSIVYRRNSQENTSAVSDWDEEFSGEMLEKVCLFAELSQANIKDQPILREFEKEKPDHGILQCNRAAAVKPKPCSTSSKSTESEGENLKLELEKLQEKLKTREGEVHILRSQLKQSEDAKQGVALQNIRAIEEIQKKYIDKMNLTEKELESTKSKLLFKDLEYKTLSERCRQLEYNLSKTRLKENASTQSFYMSQTFQQKGNSKEVDENNKIDVVESCNRVLIDFERPTKSCHEGKSLAKAICPEFFNISKETNILGFYNFHNESNCRQTKMDLDKKKGCNCNDLPKQTVFIKDLNISVSNLFTFRSFTHKGAQEIIHTILNSCVEILTHVNEVLLFLEKLQLCSDYDRADQCLLENENPVKIVSLRHLIDGEKQRNCEYGIEARRSLALVLALMKISDFTLNTVKNNVDFLILLKKLATAIGTLRRPLWYNGVLISIALILQQILEEFNLTKECLKIIGETVEELIFCRPKLDVLLEVVKILIAGRHHFEFVVSLCRKDSVDSCTLYMDCKLKQAMFFTKSTCPLKLLCMQIMGLASLPFSNSIIWEITGTIISWINSSINTSFHKKIKWLPTNLDVREECCFNVTECLLFLLTQCLKDYFETFSQETGVLEKNEKQRQKFQRISIIGDGSILLKRILKVNQRFLHDNTYSLRFAMLLTAVLPHKSHIYENTHLSYMTPLQIEAVTWITDLLENGLRNQDYCFKQNVGALTTVDFFNALKINDEPKIY